ncbi:thioredoxin domain-containing protein [Candidatus Woesebacteria bacterium]|nr:thioredoxin domain-containing protein [Candidatus Woesebacteria bacterium]
MPEIKNKEGLLERFVPVLLVLTIALAFVVGVLWNKVSTMEKGGVTKTAGNVPEPSVNGKLSEDQAKNLEKPSEKDHIRGSLDAEIYLIEYSDLECPFCASFHPTAQQALSEYGDKIAWIYRHFPLDTIHPRATPAANAAECVSSLGGNDAFWSFVDEVFADPQTNLSEAGLKSTAVSVGISGDAFSSCYLASKFQGEVDADTQSGDKAGVTGTPGNFIMNKKGEIWVIPGAVPFASLKATIDEALQ